MMIFCALSTVPAMILHLKFETVDKCQVPLCCLVVWIQSREFSGVVHSKQSLSQLTWKGKERNSPRI